jgi:hypothetical protein
LGDQSRGVTAENTLQATRLYGGIAVKGHDFLGRRLKSVHGDVDVLSEVEPEQGVGNVCYGPRWRMGSREERRHAIRHLRAAKAVFTQERKRHARGLRQRLLKHRPHVTPEGLQLRPALEATTRHLPKPVTENRQQSMVIEGQKLASTSRRLPPGGMPDLGDQLGDAVVDLLVLVLPDGTAGEPVQRRGRGGWAAIANEPMEELSQGHDVGLVHRVPPSLGITTGTYRCLLVRCHRAQALDRS